jgi:hypothetical protein
MCRRIDVDEYYITGGDVPYFTWPAGTVELSTLEGKCELDHRVHDKDFRYKPSRG